MTHEPQVQECAWQTVLHSLLKEAGGQAEIFLAVRPDRDFELIHANIHAMDLFGLARVPTFEEPIPQGDLPQRLAEYVCQALSIFDPEREVSLPMFELREREGVSLSVKLRSAQTLDLRGQRTDWFLFCFSDVTPWLQLQEEVMNARRLESIGSLASGVAHDFNNIIMAIQGNAEFLLMLGGQNEQAVKLLEAIVRGCAHGAALTRSLLGYARKQSLDMEILDLSSLVEDVVQLCVRSFGARIKIEVLSPLRSDGGQAASDQKGHLRVYGCYSALSHCLVNLLNNARDAMPDGGLIQIGGEARQDEIELWVTDHGVGIPADRLERIFDPFFTTKAKGTGTGLGLSMVQGIMQQHGGRVAVRSTVGQGTTVSLIWPTLREDFPSGAIRPVPQPEERTKPVAHQPGDAWVIDDDSQVVTSVSNLLQLQGYVTTQFTSAGDALRRFDQSGLPTLIFVDYTMPDLDGVEFIRRLHDRTDVRSLPENFKLVLMSGFPPDRFHQLTREFHRLPIYLLQKPFSLSTLQKMIETKPRNRFLRRITSRIQPPSATER